MKKSVLVGIALAWVGSMPACSSDDGDGATSGGATSGQASCPDVSGTWKITAHSCMSSAVGSTLTIHQSGCNLTELEPWGWSGTIDAAGKMAWSGPAAGGMPMTCNATLSGTKITSSCM